MMAYDDSSIPKDLRPLNIMRNGGEEVRISPATSCARPVEGYYASPPTEGSPSNMPTVYYPATIQETGFVPTLAFKTGVSGWVQQIVQPQLQQTSVVGTTVLNPGGVYATSPNYGPWSSSDHASDEGCDDPVSGRKVKFLCSFGGKILPRLSDGALRYVGGQTRIISVRRDIMFGEFVQKMTDTYVQNAVIKYQLPDEDLDALVSVSCPDDLENMMDEYEKLTEVSSDGSASKLRILLFSPSDLESGGNIGDLQDSGQRYVEAVNGIGDGFGGGCDCIVRKESIESTVSTQNSDVSCVEGGDTFTHIGLPSMGYGSGNGSVVPFEAPRMVYPADSCVAPLSIPIVKTSPTPSLGSVPEQEMERSVPLSVPQASTIVSYPTSIPYHQETSNHANYLQLSPQMGFPTQILGTMRPVFTQQPIASGAAATSPQQFHMTMNPSFISMRPNVVSAVGQPQQVRVENLTTESIMSQRVVQLSATQGYNVNQAGGVYNRHPEQMALSERSLSPQQERITIIEDCQVCQKALPQAHSDTSSPDQKSSPSSTISDGLGRPIIRPVVTGTIPEGNIEQQLVRARAVCNEDHEHGKIQTDALSGVSQGVVMTSRVQVPYGVVMAKSPRSCSASAIQNLGFQSQLQVIPETSFDRPLNTDFTHVGMPLQKDRDSPNEISPKVATGCPVDDFSSLAYDNLRKVDGKLDNLRINPSEVVYKNEQNKTITDPRKEDLFQIHVGEALSMHSLYTSSAVGASHSPSEDAAGSTIYSGVESNREIDRMLPYTEWDDSPIWSQQRVGERDVVGDILDNSTPQYIYQDPWNISPDSQYPPPKPSKIQVKKDNTGLRDPLGDNHIFSTSETPTSNYMDSLLENSLDDLSPNHSLSNKGSAEEEIKRELQAVAEGVAASVFNSSILSNPELSVNLTNISPPISQKNPDSQNANADDEIKTKLSEKINLGFPSSGIGRLQIIKNSDLEELRELGSGTFGTVYHGKWRGTDVAIKRINDRCFSEKPSELERMRDDFWNEAIKLADLHHPNVVAFYGVVLDGPDGSVATVTEYMVNGSLRNALQRNDRILDKRKRLLIGMDVAFGMEYLHGKNIVHFDLKSDNLLVNLRDPHRPICKVGDLGLSKAKCQTLISGGVRGTLPWMAPELLNGSSTLVTEKVDVFSFGIVMWELLTGEEPYADLHYGAIIGGIVSNTLRPSVPEICDPDWTSLMERCWSSEISIRPNFTEIADELRAMANKLPSKGQLQHANNPQPKT